MALPVLGREGALKAGIVIWGSIPDLIVEGGALAAAADVGRTGQADLADVLAPGAVYAIGALQGRVAAIALKVIKDEGYEKGLFEKSSW